MSLRLKNIKNKAKAREQIEKLLVKVKPIDLSKFAGKLMFEGDPIKLQREWRDE